jgi:hypothetical protein
MLTSSASIVTMRAGSTWSTPDGESVPGPRNTAIAGRAHR